MKLRICIAALLALGAAPVWAEMLEVEKNELTFGFIKLTDLAPLAIAYEKGFFEDGGLFVTLEPQANWKVLLDGVIDGQLDGAHMLAGQPLAATIGYGTEAHIVSPFSMDLNGNGITVSNEVWAAMKENVPHGDGKPVHPIPASALKPVVDQYRAEGRPFNMGMVFPVSTHNYELSYWLAAGGLKPGYYVPDNITGQIDADVLLSVTPPPQMPATLEAGTIQGYCVGEPWNQQAVFKGIGVPVVTDYEIWRNNPEKVFGITAEFAEAYPNTTPAITKALIRAAQWLDEDDNANRPEAVEILARSEYVGADAEVIANSMTGTFEYEKGDTRSVPDFNVFFRYYATYPYYSDAVWYLTQMRRWGQIPEGRDDAWYAETAARVYRPDIYLEAARMLVEEGLADEADFPWNTDGYREPTAEFIDGIEYDGRRPNDYLRSLPIGLIDDQSGGAAIAGDPEHPSNFGRLCPKGSALGETLDLEGRLLSPRIGGHEAGWDEALDLVAARFREAIDEHGPDSVAFYVSGQMLTEDYYAANKLMKGFIGSVDIDTNSRLCRASSAAGHRRAFGTDTVPGTYEDLEQADLVVLVRSNLAWCHPVLHQRILAAKQSRPGLTLVNIDPRRTATSELADLHLAIRPGSDIALFNGLLAHLEATGAIDVAYVAQNVSGFPETMREARRTSIEAVAVATGLDLRLLRRFNDLWAPTERTVTAYSQGINQSASGTDKVNAILNCRLATGRIGRPGMGLFSLTGQPNAMGGREVGGLANTLACHMEIENLAHREAVRAQWNAPAMPARAGLKAVDVFRTCADGRIKALWVISTNPAVSMPEADGVAAALAACPFVAVSDIVARTDTTAAADVLFSPPPAARNPAPSPIPSAG